MRRRQSWYVSTFKRALSALARHHHRLNDRARRTRQVKLLHSLLLQDGKRVLLQCVAPRHASRASVGPRLDSLVCPSDAPFARPCGRCKGGLGRACTVAALYLQEAAGLTAEASIERMRHLRGPGAIQTVRKPTPLARSAAELVVRGAAATQSGQGAAVQLRAVLRAASRPISATAADALPFAHPLPGAAVQRGDGLHAARAAAVSARARRGRRRGSVGQRWAAKTCGGGWGGKGREHKRGGGAAELSGSVFRVRSGDRAPRNRLRDLVTVSSAAEEPATAALMDTAPGERAAVAWRGVAKQVRRARAPSSEPRTRGIRTATTPCWRRARGV
jgi:hypothetical protein